MAKRKCAAKTKAGPRCSRWALDGADTCIAHAPGDVKVSMGFGGSQPGAGRPPTPRAVDVLRERIETDIDTVIGPLWDALSADTMVWAGDRDAETVPDHKTRIAAARELLDRGYGRPKQVSEVTAQIDGRHEIEIPDSAERHAAVVELLAGAGLNGNGH